MTITPTPAPTIAPPLTAEAEQYLRNNIASDTPLPFTKSELRSLLASLDEARKDSKRLDWLETNALDFEFHFMKNDVLTKNFATTTVIRAVIDAAMSKKGSQ